MQVIIGISLVVFGVYIIVRRYIIRYKGSPIMFVCVEPVRILRNNRGVGIYGYECRYTYNGRMCSSRAVEIGIYFFSMPKKRLINSMGIISSDGKVSCNHVYSTEIVGTISIVYGVIFLLQG